MRSFLQTHVWQRTHNRVRDADVELVADQSEHLRRHQAAEDACGRAK